MKIVHLLRDPRNTYAIETITSQGIDNEVELILIHDAVYMKITCSGIKTYACKDDVESRGIESMWEVLSYEEIVKKIFESDRAVCW